MYYVSSLSIESSFLTPFLASRIKHSRSLLCKSYYDEDNFLHLTADFSREIANNPPEFGTCRGQGSSKPVIVLSQGIYERTYKIMVDPFLCYNSIVFFRLDCEYIVSRPIR
jgi:hypothetical protein